MFLVSSGNLEVKSSRRSGESMVSRTICTGQTLEPMSMDDSLRETGLATKAGSRMALEEMLSRRRWMTRKQDGSTSEWQESPGRAGFSRVPRCHRREGLA